MRIGTWNHLDVLFGARGTGKSTYAAYLARKLQREGGAYVLGHSLGGRLPRRLPAELGGQELPIVYHETLASVASGVRWRPKKWHILAPKPGTAGATADDLLRFASDLSDAVRKRAWQRTHWASSLVQEWRHNRNHEDVDAPPIVVLIDEGIAVEGAGVSRKDDNRWFLEFLISLRHMHIALIWSQQDPTARSWRILEQATDLYAFRVHHAYALMGLQAAGASPEEIARIRTLPNHQHLHIEPQSLDWHAAAVEDRKGELPPPKPLTPVKESPGSPPTGPEPK